MGKKTRDDAAELDRLNFRSRNLVRTVEVVRGLVDEHPGLTVHSCRHVETGEFPPRFVLYLGEDVRALCCAVCMRATIALFTEAEEAARQERVKHLQDIYGGTDGIPR